MSNFITTIEVCRSLDLTEPTLRHVLRRPGAPRPAQHPTARVFLWTSADVRALREFMRETKVADRAAQVSVNQSDQSRGGGK